MDSCGVCGAGVDCSPGPESEGEALWGATGTCCWRFWGVIGAWWLAPQFIHVDWQGDERDNAESARGYSAGAARREHVKAASFSRDRTTMQVWTLPGSSLPVWP